MSVALPATPRFDFRRLSPFAFLLLAALPVAFIVSQAIATSRNLAFWDEYDSTLGFILRIADGEGWREFFQRLFHLDSGHRTVTSRLLYATSYWLTGGVNFHVISLIGNLTFAGLCVVLVFCTRSVEQRIRLTVILAFGLFHLQHYEPFLWAGASIDHFQILLLAGAAFAALARGTRLALVGATLLAVLATFTLAHGCMVWPIGAALLWRRRRWSDLAAWASASILGLGAFFYGFEVNSAHRFTDYSLEGLSALTRFWLSLLGGTLTFGDRSGAPAFGFALLLLLGWLLNRGVGSRKPVAMGMALFAIASLGLIALGRFTVASDHLESRYLVLSSLAWTLAGYMLLETYTDPARPYRLLAWCLPALIAFNLAANFHGAERAETFLFSRDYPAVRFKQFGDDSHGGPFRLHPGKGTVREILAETAARGIYEHPRFCELRTFQSPRPNPRIVTYVTDLTATARSVGFEGWAMLPQQRSERDAIHVVLRSAKTTLYFTTLSVARPDVATAFKEPLWRYCGYNFAVLRARLPNEDFQIGLLIANGRHAEYVMTEHWLRLADPALAPTPLATRR